FMVPNHAVVAEIILLRSTFPVGKRAIQGIADAIYHCPLYHVGGRYRVYYNATVDGAGDMLHVGLAVAGDHVHHMGSIGVMAEIGRYTPMVFFLRLRIAP